MLSMHKNKKRDAMMASLFSYGNTNYFVLGALAFGAAGVALESALAGVAVEQPVEQDPEEQHDCLPERIL